MRGSQRGLPKVNQIGTLGKESPLQRFTTLHKLSLCVPMLSRVPPYTLNADNPYNTTVLASLRYNLSTRQFLEGQSTKVQQNARRYPGVEGAVLGAVDSSFVLGFPGWIGCFCDVCNG